MVSEFWELRRQALLLLVEQHKMVRAPIWITHAAVMKRLKVTDQTAHQLLWELVASGMATLEQKSHNVVYMPTTQGLQAVEFLVPETMRHYPYPPALTEAERFTQVH